MSKSFHGFAALVLGVGAVSGCISNNSRGGLEDPEAVASGDPDASMTDDSQDPGDDDALGPDQGLDSGTPTASPGEPASALGCVFHVDAPPPAVGVDAGVADAGSEEDLALTSLTVGSSAFLGEYLADGAGRSLYIYGADLPGDCETPPVSTCANDCLLAWPVFDAGERTLPEGLIDDGFGYIDRSDGARQTTYHGWPLYYFRDDLAAQDINGHGRGDIWFAAEVQLPNLLVMRTPAAAGGVKYLGNDAGKTLYAFSADTVGNETATPVSTCTDTCLEGYRPFMPRTLRAVSTLDPSTLEVFVRADGLGTQVAYKGSPLYTSVADVNSGSWNGVEGDAWNVVLP